MSAEPVSGTRRPRRLAIAIGALALLLPLLLLYLLSHGNTRRIGTGRPQAANATAETEKEQLPRITGAADPGSPAFRNLKEPRDGALDSRGRLWIADFGNSRLRIFDRDGGYLGGWGGKGDGKHGFRDLSAVAIAGENVYVADTWNGRVESFALDGTWKAAATDLFGPRGIAVAPDGDVWVSDTGNHRIVRYDSALFALDRVGAQGSGPGQFSSPVGITAGPQGTVYVADTGNRRIVLLDSSGKFESEWPVPGWDRPVEPHLEVDGDGTVWATDPGTAEALLHFDEKGKLIDRRTSDDEGRRFSLPTGLALDRENRILYVVSSGTNTVSKVRVPAGGRRS